MKTNGEATTTAPTTTPAACGFFIAALMNAARAGQEITIKFEEDKHGTGKAPEK